MSILKPLILLAISLSVSASPIVDKQESGTLSDSHSFEDISTLATNTEHSDGLVYGDYQTYFQLGEVVFTRAAGKWKGRTSEYDVIVYNNYSLDVCLVPSFEFIENSREDLYRKSFILPANSSVELGHYGAVVLGSSWHIKWNFFVSANLEYCAD